MISVSSSPSLYFQASPPLPTLKSRERHASCTFGHHLLRSRRLGSSSKSLQFRESSYHHNGWSTIQYHLVPLHRSHIHRLPHPATRQLRRPLDRSNYSIRSSKFRILPLDTLPLPRLRPRLRLRDRRRCKHQYRELLGPVRHIEFNDCILEYGQRECDELDGQPK